MPDLTGLSAPPPCIPQLGSRIMAVGVFRATTPGLARGLRLVMGRRVGGKGV